MVKIGIAFFYYHITIKIYGNNPISFLPKKKLPFSCGHGSNFTFIVVYWWKKNGLNLLKN